MNKGGGDSLAASILDEARRCNNPRCRALLPKDRKKKRCRDCARADNQRYYEKNAVEACERSRKWREDHPEQALEQSRKWSRENPERAAKNKRKGHLIRTYGLTPEEFDRMVEEQEGSCALCGDSPKKLCVDHDHSTGKVRKLLCIKCNNIVGVLENHPDILKRAEGYIRENSSG